jgi:hypothetical protein
MVQKCRDSVVTHALDRGSAAHERLAADSIPLSAYNQPGYLQPGVRHIEFPPFCSLVISNKRFLPFSSSLDQYFVLGLSQRICR